MNKGHTFHQAMENQLRSLLKSGAETDLFQYLDGLSHADFRTAGNVLGLSILTECSQEQFWALFGLLCLYRPKAFLGTCLKAVRQKYLNGELTLESNSLKQYATTVVLREMNIDRQKFIHSLLPLLKTPQEISFLFELFAVELYAERIQYLLQSTTLPSCYVLFESARHVDHESEFLTTVCQKLINKGDRTSFNLASIMKSYFDLPKVKGTFSLNIQPFQFNYIDLSFERFSKIMNSI